MSGRRIQTNITDHRSFLRGIQVMLFVCCVWSLLLSSAPEVTTEPPSHHKTHTHTQGIYPFPDPESVSQSRNKVLPMDGNCQDRRWWDKWIVYPKASLIMRLRQWWGPTTHPSVSHSIFFLSLPLFRFSFIFFSFFFTLMICRSKGRKERVKSSAIHPKNTLFCNNCKSLPEG